MTSLAVNASIKGIDLDRNVAGQQHEKPTQDAACITQDQAASSTSELLHRRTALDRLMDDPGLLARCDPTA